LKLMIAASGMASTMGFCAATRRPGISDLAFATDRPDRPAFCTDPSRVRMPKRRVRKVGAVADRRNRGVGREQQLVDHDSIVAFEAHSLASRLPRRRRSRHDQSALSVSPSVRNDLFGVLAPLDRRDAKPKPEARAKGPVLFRKKSDMIGETARPIGRAISITVASAPRLAAVAAISSPMNPAPMMTTLGLAEALADRGRVGDVAEREDARQIHPGHRAAVAERQSRR